MDTLAGGNANTEAIVVSQQDLSGWGSGGGGGVGSAIVTGGQCGAGGGAGVEWGRCRGGGGRSWGSMGRGRCAWEVQALVDTWERGCRESGGGGEVEEGRWGSAGLGEKIPILKFISLFQ